MPDDSTPTRVSATNTDEPETLDAIFAREERQFQSALTGLPSAEYRGLVDASGTGGASSGGHDWDLVIHLAAWKSPDGILHEGKVRLEMPAPRDDISTWMAKIRPYSIIHFRARMAPHPRFGMKALTSAIIALDQRDPDLQAVSVRLQEPVTFEDPELGLFTLDRRIDSFEGSLPWQGEEVRVSFLAEVPSAAPLAVAKALCRDQNTWAQKIADRAIADLLDLKNSAWLREDEQPLTPAQFKSRMTLTSIDVSADGSFQFWHDDGDMFWGHSILVRGFLTTGPTEATIEG